MVETDALTGLPQVNTPDLTAGLKTNTNTNTKRKSVETETGSNTLDGVRVDDARQLDEREGVLPAY